MCVFVWVCFFVEGLALRFVNVEVDIPVSTLWTVGRPRRAYARLFYTVVSFFLTAGFWQLRDKRCYRCTVLYCTVRRYV